MKIPDPFKLNNGWLDEKEGIVYWPIVPTDYNIQFLMIGSDVEDVSGYKGSKAYSYFKQGWLSNISYHSLCSSKYFLFKSDYRPSERLRDPPQKLWVCLSKKEGKVMTAHCTCVAGISSKYKHVAATLFRVEAATRLDFSIFLVQQKPMNCFKIEKIHSL